MAEGAVVDSPSTVPADDSEERARPRTTCIVGLGNPGSRYAATPHNLGFRTVDELARRRALHIAKDEGSALTGSGRIGDKSVVLVKPQTFMNNSGAGVRHVLKYHNLTNRDLLVIYDELDLPWTALRIRMNGSAAGHNGVKSIIAALKTDVFTRVRVGIRPDFPVDAETYVLTPFGPDMRDEVEEVVSYTADAVESIVAEGALQAMAKFNRRARGSKEEEE
jgi:peptidyl-tRNA hydrolase, PTH1 family